MKLLEKETIFFLQSIKQLKQNNSIQRITLFLIRKKWKKSFDIIYTVYKWTYFNTWVHSWLGLYDVLPLPMLKYLCWHKLLMPNFKQKLLQLLQLITQNHETRWVGKSNWLYFKPATGRKHTLCSNHLITYVFTVDNLYYFSSVIWGWIPAFSQMVWAPSNDIAQAAELFRSRRTLSH